MAGIAPAVERSITLKGLKMEKTEPMLSYVIRPKFPNGTRVIATDSAAPGNPMYRGRIDQIHWHSSHSDDVGKDGSFMYTVVFNGRKADWNFNEASLKVDTE